jgi:predicted RecB family nuclease
MITATQAAQFIKCPRLVYLNVYGPEDKRSEFSDFQKKLQKDGIAFEEHVISKMKVSAVKYKTALEGFKKTLGLMEKGEELIYQGVLIHEGFAGIPDLLEKHSGKSKFGDWYYTATDIKQGLSAKDKYVEQIVFYSFLLGLVQGYEPAFASLILGDEKKAEIPVKERMDKFLADLEVIKQIAEGTEVEPVRCAECQSCVWYDFCFGILLKKKDLSLVYRMTKKSREFLISKGVKDLQDMADAPDTVLEHKIVGRKALDNWRLQAKSLLSNKPIRINKVDFPAKKEIYLDFESEDQVQYMIGLLVDSEVKQFIAYSRKEEGEMWKKFLSFMGNYPDCVIYHYGNYEKRVVKELAAKYGGKKTAKLLLASMHDLNRHFPRDVVLPVYSYSLKPVARFLGFSWRNLQASGDEAMVWYDLFLKTGDKKYMELIKQYNSDDLLATKKVKEWLENENNKTKK